MFNCLQGEQPLLSYLGEGIRLQLVLLLTLFIGGCTANSWRYLPEHDEIPTSIYVVGHGWHTGIVVPSHLLGAKFDFLQQQLPNANYFEFGWGDKGFYQAEEITSGLTVQAIFWPTESVMHVVSLPTEPASYFSQSEVIELKLSHQAIEHLLDGIAASFAKNKHGAPTKTRPGLYGCSWFYIGEGSYYMTNTCNSWVARMLDQAGVPIRTTLTLTASSVLSQTQDALDEYLCCLSQSTTVKSAI
ncbi:TIGR02117 family protein [Corallincola spongiicola]|uniref:TIGR02117 family protein n=1 Tax=Corallincola spongiicola TaxID=2520508 RepID=A0ABY1WQR7_9GAMM|nr:TIGR02117 family protein [Corallincola spongiicola]